MGRRGVRGAGLALALALVVIAGAGVARADGDAFDGMFAGMGAKRPREPLTLWITEAGVGLADGDGGPWAAEAALGIAWGVRKPKFLFPDHQVVRVIAAGRVVSDLDGSTAGFGAIGLGVGWGNVLLAWSLDALLDVRLTDGVAVGPGVRGTVDVFGVQLTLIGTTHVEDAPREQAVILLGVDLAKFFGP